MSQARDQITPQILRASGIFAGMAAISAALLWLHWLLRRRRKVLQRREAEQAAILLDAQEAPSMPVVERDHGDENGTGENEIEGWQERLVELRSRFLDGLDHQLSLKRRLGINRFLRWSVFWLLVIVLYQKSWV